MSLMKNVPDTQSITNKTPHFKNVPHTFKFPQRSRLACQAEATAKVGHSLEKGNPDYSQTTSHQPPITTNSPLHAVRKDSQGVR
jgi:hypothetical protein